MCCFFFTICFTICVFLCVFFINMKLMRRNMKQYCAIFKRVLSQVVLLDVNNTAGESFKEALDKEYGQENTLFFKCDVESEGQIKGNAHSQSQMQMGFRLDNFELISCF